MDEATKLPIGPEEVAEAVQILQRYKAGKAALDKRLVDNELWFRMGHWKNYQNPMMEGKSQPSSGWLFNSIANKHADAMDNYPSPNVLPRAEDDEAAAQALSSVLPVVLEQADYHPRCAGRRHQRHLCAEAFRRRHRDCRHQPQGAGQELHPDPEAVLPGGGTAGRDER